MACLFSFFFFSLLTNFIVILPGPSDRPSGYTKYCVAYYSSRFPSQTCTIQFKDLGVITAFIIIKEWCEIFSNVKSFISKDNHQILSVISSSRGQ